jgi:short subunit dehydrogenase-like uncharacterized protein
MMSANWNWMLYGAYGVTGRRILDHALPRGHRPVLAGRDPHRLAQLAGETGLPWVALSLDQAAAARLEGIDAVLNAAGPYAVTGAPLRRLCLEAGKSYVDVNGEIADYVAALAGDGAARKRGIAIIPGAGFSVTYGEALAAHLSGRLPDAKWLRLSFAPANDTESRGAAQSTAEVLAGGGYAISGGALVRRPMAHTSWRVTWPGEDRSAHRFAAIPRADLVAIHRLTGIAEVTTGGEMPLAAALLLRVGGPAIGRLIAGRAAAEKPVVPSGAAVLRSRILAEAGTADGRRATAMIETGEGYGAAAHAAVQAMEALLERRPVGALTPAQAFGPGFALSLPETRIFDIGAARAPMVLQEQAS